MIIALPLAIHGGVAAEGIGVVAAELEAVEAGYELNASFDINLTRVLENALSRGVPLYFVVEFELTRPRWYWFDATIAQVEQRWKLSYAALSRQYRLSFGSLYQNFSQLEEAKQVLGRVRGWHVLDKGGLNEGAVFEASVRMRLDVSLLPKPFQVNALASKEWNLSSDWYRFAFTP